MAGQSIPGPLGAGASSDGIVAVGDGFPPGAGFELPGPGGSDPVPLQSLQRIVTAVTRDWVPTPSFTTTPAITVRGNTLAEVEVELNARSEWGRGGGRLRTDPVPVGTSTSVTVHVRANLLRILPTWTKRMQASTAARAEWDRMLASLTVHEDRHVAIAIEEANNLANALMGVEIGEIANLVTSANQTMQTRQDEMDNDTDHGARAGVPFGDVTLNTSIP